MTEERQELAEHLRAAGCDEDIIEKYCACSDRQSREKLLLRHRRALLSDLHECQKKIDCLDYLRYKEKQ